MPSKQPKSLNFIIPLVIYPFDVMVSIGQTDDQFKQSLSQTYTEWNDLMKCEGQGRFILNPDNTSIVRLRNYPENPTDYGNLQHEIFHAVTYILDRIGMKLVLLKSDEAYAYLIGFLTQEIYKQLKINQ